MKVKISEKQNTGMDEIYCSWYKCPKCKEEMITQSCHYCPYCGVELSWVDLLQEQKVGEK